MTKNFLLSTALLAALAFQSPAAHAQTAPTLSGQKPLVIGHRGASGYMPEHTIEGYKLAIQQGADFIEPDLVSTKDGVLVVRHEPMLSGTTDVADRPEFANRKTTRKVDGVDTTDWFASDFTAAEIKTLKAKQAFADRDQSHNGKYQIPTFQEVIDLAKAESARAGRTIGIYPETKHPTYHAALGLAFEDKLLDMLKAAGWTDKNAPVFIQSFETGNLKYLRQKTQLRLVQLVDGDGAIDERDRTLIAPTNVVKDAHAAGLLVHSWTFRSEPKRLTSDFKGEAGAEYKAFFALGLDGLFSDFPDQAVKARDGK